VAIRWRVPVSLLALCMLGACSSRETGAPAAEPASKPPAAAGLVLGKEQSEKLGVVTQPVQAATYMAEISGYGQIQGHESIALLAADMATAGAAARQGSAALARMQQLAGTPGAFPVDAVENAERQSAADAAAFDLAQQKLTATLGQGGPWNTDAGRALLAELATGSAKLVRATFPAGSLGAGTPRRLRVAHFEAGGRSRDWKTGAVWEAPADAALPGRSFFAALGGSDVSEGERVQVWVTAGTSSDAGVLVPASALVLNNNAYWCFVEKPIGTFRRVTVDTTRPQGEGYFVNAGLSAGDSVVIQAAGLLLAREINPSAAAQ
jgi:hypothetical protein